MKRRGTALLACGALGLVLAVGAWAGFPNMQRWVEPTIVYGGTSTASALTATAAGAEFSDPRVFVDGIVVTGVKEGVVTSLAASYEAVYVCVNGGTNVPSAANKVVFLGNLRASASFPAAKNGKATGSLLTDPLPSAAEAAAATGFSCPPGQVLEFDRVVFSNLVLSVEGGERVDFDATLVSQSVHGLS